MIDYDLARMTVKPLNGNKQRKLLRNKFS